MTLIWILLLDALIAAVIAGARVQRKRGVLLDTPDWRLLPELVKNLFVLTFGFLLLSYYYVLHNNWATFSMAIGVSTLFLLVYLVIGNRVVGKLIWNRFRKASSSLVKKATGNKQIKTPVQDLREQDLEDEDIECSAFAEFTLMYCLLFLLLILLAELTICFVMEIRLEWLPEILAILMVIQQDLKIIDLQLISIIVAYAGIWITLIRIIMAMKHEQHRAPRKSLDMIWEYLNKSDVKN